MKDAWDEEKAKQNQLMLDERVLKHVGLLCDSFIALLIESGFDEHKACRTAFSMFTASVSKLTVLLLVRLVEYQDSLTPEQKQAAYDDCYGVRDRIIDEVLSFVRKHNVAKGYSFHIDEHKDN